MVPQPVAVHSARHLHDSTLIGRQIEKVNKKIKWFSGEINSYDEYSGKYGVYFPCDGETILFILMIRTI